MPSWTKEQSDAINQEGTNILVSAGAGSGKTAVLSERVLRKVTAGISVDDILVLTFTNAAAKEMKDRIRKKIAKVPELSSELEKIDSAYITTFDSFALSVVKKYHYLLDVPRDLSIGDASVLLLKKEEILDKIFLDFYQKKDPLFINLINSYCLKDDKEIKNFILNAFDKIDLIYEKENYLNTYIDNFYSQEYLDLTINRFAEYLKKLIGNINTDLENLALLDSGDYYEKILHILTPLLNSEEYLDIKFNSVCDLPRLPNGTNEDVKNIKESIKKEIIEIQSLCKYTDQNEIITEILSTKENILAIINILKTFSTCVLKMKREENLYDFIDIAKMAIKIVKEHDNARNFYKNKFNEILIDEYQDTSDLQDLFISQIDANNVYMVGDIKQSIYRFRNANPNLFKAKYSDYSSNKNGLKIDLNKNFRSREEVLTNINLIFDYIMNSFLGGAEYRLNQRMIFGNNTYNEQGKMIHNNNLNILNYNLEKDFNFTKDEVEIFIIANDIKEKIAQRYQIFNKDDLKKHDVLYSDFAILLDRASNFNLYKKIFEYLNIPLTIFKDESIKDVIDLKILKNIIRLLIKINNRKYDEEFRYSYVAIARSYLFNLTDDEIFKTIKNKDFYLTEIFVKAKNIAKSIDESTVSEILEQVIVEFNFYEKLITVGEIDAHIAVLEYLQNLAINLDKNYDISDFYNYLENISNGNLDISFNVKKETANSVKIMTIHKSKGLEFPICYYAGLDKIFNISDLNDKFIFDKKEGFIIPATKNHLATVITKQLLKNSYIEEEISEKIRLFYVALTRAKEKMIFVASLKENPEVFQNKLLVDDCVRLKYRSFNDFLESIYEHIKWFINPVLLDNLKLTKDYNLSVKNLNLKISESIPLKVNDFTYKLEEKKESRFSKITHKLHTDIENINLQNGLLIHSIMENMNLFNPNYELVPKKFKPMVEKFIASGIMKGVIKDYHEYEFIYNHEDTEYHGIIDLLLEYENSFVIVDYKLKNTVDEAYKKQLNGYRDYIKTLSNKPVKVFLYSFIDGVLTEINREV